MDAELLADRHGSGRHYRVDCRLACACQGTTAGVDFVAVNILRRFVSHKQKFAARVCNHELPRGAS